jgi:hypothetical protein
MREAAILYRSVAPFTIISPCYLNLSVLIAIKPRITEMIQNRTTIFPSFQPFNSK